MCILNEPSSISARTSFTCACTAPLLAFTGIISCSCCAADQLQRIHSLIDRIANKDRNEVVRDRIHSLKINALNIDLSINCLASLIEAQSNAGLRPTFKLHAVAQQIVTATKRQGRLHLSVGELHFSLHIASRRGERDRVRAPLLKRRFAHDRCAGCRLIAGQMKAGRQIFKDRSQQSIDKPAGKADDNRTSGIASRIGSGHRNARS